MIIYCGGVRARGCRPGTVPPGYFDLVARAHLAASVGRHLVVSCGPAISFSWVCRAPAPSGPCCSLFLRLLASSIWIFCVGSCGRPLARPAGSCAGFPILYHFTDCTILAYLCCVALPRTGAPLPSVLSPRFSVCRWFSFPSGIWLLLNCSRGACL